MMKNFLKKTAAVVLSGTMLLGGLTAAPGIAQIIELPAIVASAATTQTVTIGYATYTYFQNNAGMNVIKYIDLSDSCPNNYSLSVPSTLNGQTMQALGENMFRNNASKIKYLDIPNTVIYIGRKVFMECTNLDTITLPQNLQRVEETCFTNHCYSGVLNTLKLRRSNGTVFTVTSTYIESIANNTTFEFLEAPYTFRITSGNDALVNLMIAVNSTAFGQRMCREKAAKIRTNYTQNSMTDRQKMQALYNYIVTHTRYGYVRSNCGYNSFSNSPSLYYSEREIFFMNQSAMGVLFFNNGVCSGYAHAMQYLGDSAGLDIKVVSKGGHAWNLFLPSGSSKYYVVDGVWGECGTGYQYARYQYAKERLQYAEDSTTCQVSPYMMGSTRQFEVRNDKKNSNFNISLVDRNAQSKSYFSYNTYSLNDQGTLHCCDLVKPTDEFLFADLTASFDLQIRDENGYLLYTVGNLLGDVPRYCLFYDKQGQVHTVHISLNTENSDQNQRTSQKCRYVIRFDL